MQLSFTLGLLALPLFALVLRAQVASSQTTVLQVIHEAEGEMRRGDLAAAETSFQKAVQLAPKLADAYLGLGLVEMREGKLDEAQSSLTQAVHLNPSIPGTHMFLGIAQHQAGKTDAALASLQGEIDLNPQNAEALMWMGIVELEAGHPEKAASPFDQAALLKPQDKNLLYYSGRAHMLAAEASFQRLRDLDPDSALVHRTLAENYSESQQPEKAIAEYEISIKRDQNNPDLYEALGNAELKMGHVDAARSAFEGELKINPASPIALYNLGKMDVEKGKPENGIAFLRKAQAAHASPGPTDFYLGLGLAEVGQNEEAAQWLERALQNNPSPFVQQGAWYQLARVYPKLDRKADAQHALAELKTLLQKAEAQKQVTAVKVPKGSAVESRTGTGNETSHP